MALNLVLYTRFMAVVGGGGDGGLKKKSSFLSPTPRDSAIIYSRI